jgi:hypothetical protein
MFKPGDIVVAKESANGIYSITRTGTVMEVINPYITGGLFTGVIVHSVAGESYVGCELTVQEKHFELDKLQENE